MTDRRAFPRAPLFFAAVFVSLALASCGGGDDGSTTPPATSPTGMQTSVQATTATQASTEPMTTETRQEDGDEGSGQTLGLSDFRSPSRNIACYIVEESVRCDIENKDWSVSRPPGCDLDYGQGLTVGRSSSRGEVVCAGDTALGGSARELPYGSSTRFASFTCSSRQSGITCTNGRGHGFFISRASYRLF